MSTSPCSNVFLRTPAPPIATVEETDATRELLAAFDVTMAITGAGWHLEGPADRIDTFATFFESRKWSLREAS